MPALGRRRGPSAGPRPGPAQMLGDFFSGKCDQLPAGSDTSWLGERMPRLRQLLGIQLGK